MTITDQRQSGRASAENPKSSFRPDVQGLRAIAVGAVLLFHANAPFLPGGFVGVDVFFVISGFLITGLLIKEALATRRVSMVGFYARRAKRILPAATLVLVTVAILTVVILPRTRWEDTGGQIVGSATYVVNWVLASSAVNYLNGDSAASPVQHFWTLAVEEQFYIIWPIVLVLVIALAKAQVGQKHRSGRRPLDPNVLRRFALLGICVIAIPSFIWSIFDTQTDPASAYFVTSTRLWELGLGAIAAVTTTQLARMPNYLRAPLGWGGLVAIAAACFLYTNDTPFPGYAALLPTLGALGILVGGIGGNVRYGVGVVLSVRPMRWLGDISYSLYLWHWPLIVFGTYLLSGLTFFQGMAIVVISFVPAVLSYKYVEQPILKSPALTNSNALTLQLGATMMVLSALAGMSILMIPKPISQAGQVPLVSGSLADGSPAVLAMGAVKLAESPESGAAVDSVTGGFVPSAIDAPADNPSVYADKCHRELTDDDAKSCTYGDAQSDFTVALVGDSHAAQWVPALQVLARENGWRLDTYTKSGCPLADLPISANGNANVYANCITWNQNVQAALATKKPDLVITSSLLHLPIVDGNVAKGDEISTLYGDGLKRSWQQLSSIGVPIVAIVDTPLMGINVPECVSVNETTLTKCAIPSDKALAGRGVPEEIAKSGTSGVSVINLNAMICPESLCAAVVGNVLVYRDDSHLTATYSTTLAPALKKKLAESVAGIPMATDAPTAP